MIHIPFIFLRLLSLSHLYTQCGAQTHNPKVKSRTLHRQSPPGAPFILLKQTSHMALNGYTTFYQLRNVYVVSPFWLS